MLDDKLQVETSCFSVLENPTGRVMFSIANYTTPRGNTRQLGNVWRNFKYQLLSNLADYGQIGSEVKRLCSPMPGYRGEQSKSRDGKEGDQKGLCCFVLLLGDSYTIVFVGCSQFYS